MQKLRCARCGCEIETPEYVQNLQLLKILGVDCMLHFCDGCKILADLGM